MPAATLNLTGDKIIEQGSFWSITLQYPGDMMRARLKGQIRKKFGGELIAEFRFNPTGYDSVSDKTSILMFLGSRQTEPMPIPATSETWVYDVVIYPLTQPDPVRILQGRVSVSPGVTDV